MASPGNEPVATACAFIAETLGVMEARASQLAAEHGEGLEAGGRQKRLDRLIFLLQTARIHADALRSDCLPDRRAE